MKKFYLPIVRFISSMGICAVLVFLMNSCDLFNAIDALNDYAEIINMYQDTDYDYAGYAGMGASEEPLDGTAYVLPAGVTISGIITGNGYDEYDEERGSGGLVQLSFIIKNARSTNVDVVFPQGLTTQNTTSEYQNGILAKQTSVTVPAQDSVYLHLLFYCLNVSAHASDASAIYNIGPITTIEAFKPLFEVCKNKKINIEQYGSKTDKYESASSLVQSIVWCITHGKTFKKSQIKDMLSSVDND